MILYTATKKIKRYLISLTASIVNEMCFVSFFKNEKT